MKKEGRIIDKIREGKRTTPKILEKRSWCRIGSYGTRNNIDISERLKDGEICRFVNSNVTPKVYDKITLEISVNIWWSHKSDPFLKILKNLDPSILVLIVDKQSMLCMAQVKWSGGDPPIIFSSTILSWQKLMFISVETNLTECFHWTDEILPRLWIKSKDIIKAANLTPVKKHQILWVALNHKLD